MLTFPLGCGNILKHSPMWWNWQTRGTQNPVVAIPCGFDPHHRHHLQPRKLSGFRGFCFLNIILNNFQINTVWLISHASDLCATVMPRLYAIFSKRFSSLIFSGHSYSRGVFSPKTSLKLLPQSDLNFPDKNPRARLESDLFSSPDISTLPPHGAERRFAALKIR